MHLEKIDLRNQPNTNFYLELRGGDGIAQQWTSIIGSSGIGKTTLLLKIFENASSSVPIFLYGTHRKCLNETDLNTSFEQISSEQSVSERSFQKKQETALAKEILIGTSILPPEAEDLDIIDGDVRILIKRGKSSKWQSLHTIPSSYLLVIEWILDLIQRLVIGNRIASPSELKAIVLIDDVDAQLDPVWQAKLPQALKKTLPNVQFVTTAKSAAFIAGLSPNEIVKIGYNAQKDCIQRMLPNMNGDRWEFSKKSKLEHLQSGDPRMMTATEIYQSYFEIDRLTLNRDGDLLRSYSALKSAPDRNSYQDEKLQSLREEVEHLFS